MVSNGSINIKGIELKSKFFFAPINTGLASNGNPTEELLRFHSLRSNKFTGINYVGNVAIGAEKTTNKGTLYINSSMQNYSELAAEIRKGGSIPGIQIACFYSKFQAQRNWVSYDPKRYVDFIRSEVGKLKPEQIKEIVKSFQNAIRILSKLGFEVIQLHGAHGYFLNSFLSETFNVRTDEYGQDKTLILKEILNGVDSVLKNSIIDIRVSLFEDAIKERLSEREIHFLNNIYQIPEIDIVSISNGIYNINKQLIYPGSIAGVSFMSNVLSEFIKTQNRKIWNISGNVRNISELISETKQVTYSIGRPIIADHDFLKKHHEGRREEINECEYKNQCHYFSLGKRHIECSVNKKLY